MRIALDHSTAWGQRACMWRLSNLRTIVLGRTCALTFGFQLQQSKESKVRKRWFGICHVCENRTGSGWWPFQCLKQGKVLSSITIHKFTPHLALFFFGLIRSIRFSLEGRVVLHLQVCCVWVAIVSAFVIFWGEIYVEATFFSLVSWRTLTVVRPSPWTKWQSNGVV